VLAGSSVKPAFANPHHPTCTNDHGASYMYRGTSLIRNRRPLGSYSRTIPRALWGSYGGGHFLMGEVPLYTKASLSQLCRLGSLQWSKNGAAGSCVPVPCEQRATGIPRLQENAPP